MDVENLILYQDEALLVVDKPAGLLTLVDGWNPEAPYLAGMLKAVYPALWVVHRLDRETSGVMVFARTADAHRNLNRQFELHTVGKVYHALVSRAPDWEEKSVKLALRPNGDRRHRTVVDTRRGKRAHTDLRVLRRSEAYTLIEAVPHTGRTHQVRAHLAAIGLPILGDELYRGEATEGISRAALHARSLRLAHPDHGGEMVFEAAYPQDFQQMVETR